MHGQTAIPFSLFSDITKAYDVINNEILLKLEYYGIWIESYFLYRSQFVEIFKTDNTRSN